MSRQYIDFVPSRARKVTTTKTAVVSRPKTGVVSRPKAEVIVPKVRVVSRPKVVAPREAVPKTVVPKQTQPRKAEPRLGVIEDLGTNYRGVEVVPKNNVKRDNVGKSDLKTIKAKKVGLGEISEKTTSSQAKTEDKKTYKTPKSPFINQDKVVKRPLSKNVYQKKVEVPKEKPKGPVTIITKPEKQAHVSLIVTIILTIILGAAAGTVAFLLLPK